MAEELPGFIPRVLQLDDVSLLRADEAVLNAMVDGWRAQMLARGLAVSTITARRSLIGRFVEFTNEHPWRWRPLDLDQFLADLRSRETAIELSTLRSYGNAISMFCSYASDGRYGWVAFCERHFSDVPSQICFEWNTLLDTTRMMSTQPPEPREVLRPRLEITQLKIDQLPGEPWLWAREEASVERGGLGRDLAVASVGAVADFGDRAGVGDFAEHGEGGVGL
jgi:integrase/recombinase XerD